jgi:hypothetical protein
MVAACWSRNFKSRGRSLSPAKRSDEFFDEREDLAHPHADELIDFAICLGLEIAQRLFAFDG